MINAAKPDHEVEHTSAGASVVLGVGYVGSALVQLLLGQGKRVVAMDNFFSTDAIAARSLGGAPKFTLLRGSISDRAALDVLFETAGQVDHVYLLAAQSSASAEAAPAEYTEVTNLRGPRIVLEAMRAHGIGSIVFGSSTRVYGNSIPADADGSTRYGVFSDLSHLSKIYAEKLFEMHSMLPEHNALRCLSVRLGLVYGVAPVLKVDYRFMTAPNKFCLQAARGEPLVVNGGNEVALIHVVDAARALVFAAERSEYKGFVAINAATEVASIAEVARLVRSAGATKGMTAELRLPADAPDAPARALVDTRLSRDGFRASMSLADGISETLDRFASMRDATSTERVVDTDGGPRSAEFGRCQVGDQGGPEVRSMSPVSAAAASTEMVPLVLLKCRPTRSQLADRFTAPVPDGLELYMATEDLDGPGWLDRVVERFAEHSAGPAFAIIVEGPLRSLDGEFFDLTRDTPANRLVVDRLAALGRALGARAANIHAIAPTSDIESLGRRATASALKACLPLLGHYADVCARAGIEPLIENIPPVARMREGGYWFTPIGVQAEDLVWLRRAVPDVGFTIDVSHAQLYVNAMSLDDSAVDPDLRPLLSAYRESGVRCGSLLDYVEAAAEGIVNVHVANATGLLGEGAPYAEGDADLDPVIARLSRLAKYIVTETLEPDPDKATLMRDAQARIRQVLSRQRESESR